MSEEMKVEAPVADGWVAYDCPTQDEGEIDSWSCGECAEPADWCLPSSAFLLLRCHEHVPRSPVSVDAPKVEAPARVTLAISIDGSAYTPMMCPDPSPRVDYVRADLQRFLCPDCGLGVKADEDGLCATCGRDCAIVVVIHDPEAL